ncbi:uncharacterized protein LOC135393574 [Ornithodoros turicata]|uniref:uncharacterized protein LOC135393574 n=1 Tax=Ornithodoros turicata TaxID=34597 RepID=UPI00313919EE
MCFKRRPLRKKKTTRKHAMDRRRRPQQQQRINPLSNFTMPKQMVYVFPEAFSPECVRLVTDTEDGSAAVACLLGFFKLVAPQGYLQVLQACDRDGLWLDEVAVTEEFLDRELACLELAPSYIQPNMDDFYLLFTVMLCNLPRVKGSNLNRDWFQNRANDLVDVFKNCSKPPKVPLYDVAQADAIARFGEAWPHTRAAICNAILKTRYEGRMQDLKEYVAVGWRFAGMKHIHLILEFLAGKNSWVLDVIPELRPRNDRLHALLEAYQRLGEDGPYMKLLNLPEAQTTLRKHLSLHVAAAYALAVFEDDNWLQYKGVPRDEFEQTVYEKITAIKAMGMTPQDEEPQ